MPTPFDSIFAGSNGVGATLINLMGISAIYTHRGVGEYDPRTDTMKENETKSSVKVSPLLKYSVYEMDKLGLTLEDSKVIGKGNDFPDITNKQDSLEINGETFVIVDHKVVYSGESVAIVTMQVRKREAV